MVTASGRGCPKGGTHVFPYVGARYDDDRCLKCGVPWRPGLGRRKFSARAFRRAGGTP